MISLYGVYDKRAESYTGLFSSENDSTAVRSFQGSIAQVPDDFLADYELHCLADYDDKTGAIFQPVNPSSKPEIRFIVSLASLKHE